MIADTATCEPTKNEGQSEGKTPDMHSSKNARTGRD